MKKILIIEDEKDVRTTIVDLLESVGYETISVEDGLEAINYLEKEIPDMVISDIMMPKVDGFQVLKHFQNLSNAAMVPFIFLTARVDNLDIRKGMNSGANDYLTKPFRAKELLQIVETQFRKKEKSDKVFDSVFTDITAYVPHELRTPLIPIIGYSELLREELENFSKEETLEMLSKIIHSSHRLHRTIEKFIKYTDAKIRISKKSAAEYSGGEEIYSTNELISEICNKIAKENNRLNDLKINIKDARIKIYPDDFEFIVDEMMTNAVKFSDRGTKILVDGDIIDDNYELKITDYGRGMSPKQLANINPFVQHEREKYQQAGNGLGLITIKKLMEYYNGNLKLNSRINEYTSCTVLIPVNE